MAAKTKWRTSATYEQGPHSFERVDASSETVQGESYTIRELYERVKRMNDPDIERPVIFLETEDYDAVDFGQLRRLDLVDQEEYLRRVKKQHAAAERIVKDFRAKEAEKAKAELSQKEPVSKEEGNERSVETE